MQPLRERRRRDGSVAALRDRPDRLGVVLNRRGDLDRLAAGSGHQIASESFRAASVQLGRHRLRPGHEALEDGTASFLDIAALEAGFDLLDRVGFDALTSHVDALTRQLLATLSTLAHSNGQAAVRIYGPRQGDDRGGTVAFNVLDRFGVVLPYQLVEKRADEAGVHVRGGCFCNPGASETAAMFACVSSPSRRCRWIAAIITSPRVSRRNPSSLPSGRLAKPQPLSRKVHSSRGS